MQMKKIAILIDWENIRKQIFEVAKDPLKLGKYVNYNQVDNVITFARAFVERDEEIYRIFFYLAKPLDKVSWNGQLIDFSTSPVYNNSVRFIENIAQKDLVAIREGKLKFRGYKGAPPRPDFIQKQADMLIGLDISQISFNRLVDRILVLSYDTDLVPAMKIARTNGIQMSIGYCPDIQVPSQEIMRHCDFMRGRHFQNIFP